MALLHQASRVVRVHLEGCKEKQQGSALACNACSQGTVALAAKGCIPDRWDVTEWPISLPLKCAPAPLDHAPVNPERWHCAWLQGWPQSALMSEPPQLHACVPQAFTSDAAHPQ